jgi:hypothetical protein
MLEAMGVWFPVDLYHDWPVLLPWVVRDPSCRGNTKHGVPDTWSSPNESGYLRDDNSLIKALPRSLPVRTPTAGPLNGARMGSEFVASHVWRIVDDEKLASRLPLLNSFVPNLVWLPSQVAKLTDLEGGVVQRALQSMAFAIYRHAPVAPHLQEVVTKAWAMIPAPRPIALSPSKINWFEVSDQFRSTRLKRLTSVVEALEQLDAGKPLTTKVVTSRFTAELPQVAMPARQKLLTTLRQFLPDQIDLVTTDS